MEDLEQARRKILDELMSDDADVRADYLRLFGADAREFSVAMAEAFMLWRSLDDQATGNKKRAYIAAMVYTAITLHVLSMKLFLSGQVVAAGNLARQTCESIALAFVCSSKSLGLLDRFIDGKFKANVAVKHLRRHRKILGLRDDGVKALEDAYTFYHKYSHPTDLTLAASTSFSEEQLYVGAAFDEGKIEAYKKEVSGRVSLAKVFPNFVHGVIANVANW